MEISRMQDNRRIIRPKRVDIKAISDLSEEVRELRTCDPNTYNKFYLPVLGSRRILHRFKDTSVFDGCHATENPLNDKNVADLQDDIHHSGTNRQTLLQQPEETNSTEPTVSKPMLHPTANRFRISHIRITRSCVA